MSKVNIDKQKCKGCLLCLNVCPLKSIRQSGEFNKLGVKPVEHMEATACSGCCLCAIICPDCCIEVWR